MAVPPLLLVAFGGALGATLRHLTGRWALAAFGSGFPWGTLGVNVGGGLAMGLLAGWLATREGAEPLRLLLGVGVLGGFTTFSAFSLDVVTLASRGDSAGALGYTLASVAGSIAALTLGLRLARLLA